MTVELANPDEITYHTLKQNPNHASALLSSTTEENELRNVSFKSVIASKYTLLNETVLELFGITNFKLDGQQVIEDEKDASEYKLWLGRLQNEVEELKQEKQNGFKINDEFSTKLAVLNQNIDQANDIPTGHKVIPQTDSHYKIHENKFKSSHITYERASTLEKEQQVSQLREEILQELPATTEPPVIGAIADAPELASISVDESASTLSQDPTTQVDDPTHLPSPSV